MMVLMMRAVVVNTHIHSIKIATTSLAVAAATTYEVFFVEPIYILLNLKFVGVKQYVFQNLVNFVGQH